MAKHHMHALHQDELVLYPELRKLPIVLPTLFFRVLHVSVCDLVF